MNTRTGSAILAGALLLICAAAMRAQDTQPDHRWQAWLGCWEPRDAEPEAATTQLVCVIPATGTSAVEMLTVVDGRVVAREHVAASAAGDRVASTRNGCTGWESAEWSPQGQRVYLRSEYACPDGVRRTSSGLMAMSETGEWLDVQGVALPGGQTGVRVRRYREAGALSQSSLPEEIAVAPRGGVRAVAAARAAAGASLTTADVVEATRHLETAVVEAWLAARGQGFAIDAKGLVALADAGVPTPVIDLVVALSYPKVFAVNPVSRQADFLPHTSDSSGYAYTSPYEYSPWDYSPYYYTTRAPRERPRLLRGEQRRYDEPTGPRAAALDMGFVDGRRLRPRVLCRDQLNRELRLKLGHAHRQAASLELTESAGPGAERPPAAAVPVPAAATAR